LGPSALDKGLYARTVIGRESGTPAFERSVQQSRAGRRRA